MSKFPVARKPNNDGVFHSLQSISNNNSLGSLEYKNVTSNKLTTGTLEISNGEFKNTYITDSSNVVSSKYLESSSGRVHVGGTVPTDGDVLVAVSEDRAEWSSVSVSNVAVEAKGPDQSIQYVENGEISGDKGFRYNGEVVTLENKDNVLWKYMNTIFDDNMYGYENEEEYQYINEALVTYKDYIIMGCPYALTDHKNGFPGDDEYEGDINNEYSVGVVIVLKYDHTKLMFTRIGKIDPDNRYKSRDGIIGMTDYNCSSPIVCYEVGGKLTVLVGSLTHNNNKGIVFVYQNNGSDTEFELKSTIQPDDLAGQEAYFGCSVSTVHHNDKYTLLVGGCYDSPLVGSSGRQGAFWVYESMDGINWTKTNKIVNDRYEADMMFGSSVNLVVSDNKYIAAISAVGDETLNVKSGSVYVYEKNGDDGEWVDTARIDPLDTLGTNHIGLFGKNIVLDNSSGKLILFVLSPLYTVNEMGAVFVYEYIDGLWENKATIAKNDPGYIGEIKNGINMSVKYSLETNKYTVSSVFTYDYYMQLYTYDPSDHNVDLDTMLYNYVNDLDYIIFGNIHSLTDYGILVVGVNYIGDDTIIYVYENILHYCKYESLHIGNGVLNTTGDITSKYIVDNGGTIINEGSVTSNSATITELLHFVSWGQSASVGNLYLNSEDYEISEYGTYITNKRMGNIKFENVSMEGLEERTFTIKYYESFNNYHPVIANISDIENYNSHCLILNINKVDVSNRQFELSIKNLGGPVVNTTITITYFFLN